MTDTWSACDRPEHLRLGPSATWPGRTADRVDRSPPGIDGVALIYPDTHPLENGREAHRA